MKEDENVQREIETSPHKVDIGRGGNEGNEEGKDEGPRGGRTEVAAVVTRADSEDAESEGDIVAPGGPGEGAGDTEADPTAANTIS